jgi:hypothetical protein
VSKKAFFPIYQQIDVSAGYSPSTPITCASLKRVKTVTGHLSRAPVSAETVNTLHQPGEDSFGDEK